MTTVSREARARPLKALFLGEGRVAQCPSNPEHPKGLVLDLRASPTAPHCAIELVYPAPCIGAWVVTCERCGKSVGCTAAGRADDPRRMIVPCNPVAA